MQIKLAKQSSFLKNGLVLLGIIVLLLSSGYFIREKEGVLAKHTRSAPDTSDFLQKESTLLEVFAHYKEGHTIFLSVKDEASYKFPKEMRKKMAAIGGKELAQLGMRYSYAGVFKNGKIIEEAMSKSKAVSLEHEGAKVESAGNSHGDYSRLSLNAIKHTAENRGLNLFVVNKMNQLIGVWNFDFYESEAPLSSAASSKEQELERIEITLSEKQYNKLKKKRDAAIKNQILLSGDEDLVPANLLFKEKEYGVKMRLKGDWVDHLQGDQWSFRVKIGDGKTLMGMRKFSLHRPAARNYAGEWLFHQVLADAGIMHLQYHFVQVVLTVEGEFSSETKNLGIYALEEGFDKLLIERNQRREGVILKLDENLLWKERAAFLKGKLGIADLLFFNFSPYEQMNVLPFSEKRVVADTVLYKQFLTGSALFRDYANRKKMPSEVYDVQLLAKYQALTNLLGADHSMAAHNYRVYYNPVTSKLEPIGFDGNAGKKMYYFMDYYGSENDQVYKRAYVEAVEEVTSDEFVERLINWPGLDQIVNLMKAHFPNYEWTENTFIHNQKNLRRKINPIQSLRVNYIGIENGHFSVSIENFSRFPVEVHNLLHKGKRAFTTMAKPVILTPSSRTTVAFPLDKNYKNIFTNKKKKKTGFDFSKDFSKIKVQYNTLGSSQIRTEILLPWNAKRNGYAASDPFQREPNAHEFDFLVFDEKAKTITCMAGHWQLEKPLTIPPGYTFVAGPGCRLELLSQFISIYSFSPLRFIGTPDNPVEIFSNTGAGRGLLVLNTQDTSILEYCQFDGLANPQTQGWSVTGAVNFYEADVNMAHCSFSRNRCEDALNILRSHFEMDNCVFTDIQADAFDGDFVTGTVKNCIFADIGNDAIDVSGSKITLENVAIEKAGDKGISAGEGSHINASHIVVKNSEIALASKDNSSLTVKNGRLANNHLCFTAFQKKPEFGPASITADSIGLDNCQLLHLIENGSSLKLDGQNVETVEGVKGKMYGIEFGKSSK